MADTNLNADQEKIIDKVRKLMNLANKNPNEAEAASAIATAQRWLVAYNLDMSMIGEFSAGDAKREQARLKGGTYKHQRWLWDAVAELNFCVHWCDQKFVTVEIKKRYADGTPYVRKDHHIQWHHFLVGRVINVKATEVMAEYLEQAIERQLRNRLADRLTGFVPSTQLFTNWSVSYRVGAAVRIVEKLEERRNALLAEENAKRAAAMKASGSTSNALTITAFQDAETDANMDFIYGEGWSARQAAERAEKAAARRRAQEEWTAWALAHPAEAKKAEEDARNERQRKASRKRGGGRRKEYDNIDYSAYNSGYEAAEAISIDQQVDGGPTKRIEAK